MKTVRKLNEAEGLMTSPPVDNPCLMGPGLHLGIIELLSEDSLKVRLLAGRRLSARVSPLVHFQLVQECLRDQRPMILVDSERGAEVVGALQVAPSLALDREGNLNIKARTVRLQGTESIRLEAGRSELRLHEDGRTRLTSERTVMDAASSLRIYSASVELP